MRFYEKCSYDIHSSHIGAVDRLPYSDSSIVRRCSRLNYEKLPFARTER